VPERVGDGLVQRLPRRRRRAQLRAELAHQVRGHAEGAHGRSERSLASAAALARHI